MSSIGLAPHFAALAALLMMAGLGVAGLIAGAGMGVAQAADKAGR